MHSGCRTENRKKNTAQDRVITKLGTCLNCGGNNDKQENLKYTYISFYLFVDSKDPSFDIGVVVVGDVVDGEDGAVLLGVPRVGPEGGELLLEYTNNNINLQVMEILDYH